jgi:hypothetical protein
MADALGAPRVNQDQTSRPRARPRWRIRLSAVDDGGVRTNSQRTQPHAPACVCACVRARVRVYVCLCLCERKRESLASRVCLTGIERARAHALCTHASCAAGVILLPPPSPSLSLSVTLSVQRPPPLAPSVSVPGARAARVGYDRAQPNWRRQRPTVRTLRRRGTECPTSRQGLPKPNPKPETRDPRP